MTSAASRSRWSPGTVVLGLEVLATAVGLAIVAAGSWRLGVGVVGGALVCGSFARTLLTERAAGLLRVRRPTADVVVMTGLGVVLIVLSILVPEQPSP